MFLSPFYFPLSPLLLPSFFPFTSFFLPFLLPIYLMSISLANKYRSTTFDDLVGQDHISDILKYQAAHHTRQANYLFFWPRGTGKTSSARLFAKAINCLNTSDGNPCNSCDNCKAISEGTTMDIMEIDAASHTWVDNIREEIIDKLMYRPTMLKKRVTIIDEVHMLSKGAFNALLKTMEEPSDWMVFILATTELTKVPDTIVSRCQVFNFKKIPVWQIVERLVYIANKENITTTDEGLQMIAGLSDGCMRDAVKYLDQISVMGEVTGERVSQFLWVVSDAMISAILDHIKTYQTSQSASDFDSLIQEISKLSEQWVDLTLFPKQLMQYADHHFSENSGFYSEISQFASTLLSQAKWYPHPLLLYKTVLFQLKTSSTLPTGRQEQQATEVKVSTKESKSVSSWAQWNAIEGSSQNNNPSSTQDLDSSVVPPSEWQIQDKSFVQDDESKIPLSEWQANEIQTTETSLNASEGSESSASFISLLSPSLKNLLDGQSEITSIEWEIAKIIILNPLAKMIVNKKENHDAICSAITQTSGQTISHCEFSFMSKDEYFKMKMGG